MGKRKTKKKGNVGGDDVASLEVEEEEGSSSSRFFACYLLTSLSPRFKGHTYIGFTVNPRRRIRQHNGEVRMGAYRTKRKRPWEMVLCIYGFPTNVSALQFEWAWQHPLESRAVRQAAASFKKLGGVANKIKLAYTMLTLPEWQSLNLTVNFFSTKYTIHSAGCPSLPEHMRVQVRALDELPCNTGNDRDEFASEDWNNCEEYDGSSEKLTDEGSGRSTASDSSASNQDSTEENVEEHIDWREEPDEHAEEHSSTHTEDLEQSYILIDSPAKASSPIQSRYFNIADDDFNDNYKSDEEFGGIQRQQPNKLCMTNLDAYQDPMQTKTPGLSRDIEVIDVFTPPCYKGRSAYSKKRRLSTACSEIIDLTESPVFV